MSVQLLGIAAEDLETLGDNAASQKEKNNPINRLLKLMAENKQTVQKYLEVNRLASLNKLIDFTFKGWKGFL